LGPRLFIADAFTAEPFRGNPAAVCLLDAPAEESWMQSVAAEMNLSETAFLLREDGAFRLRWFTPACEVRLCGHATLASAHVLFEDRILALADEAVFRTKSGVLRAVRDGSSIELDFPALSSVPQGAVPAAIEAAGADPLSAHEIPVDAIGEPTVILELANETAVRELRPNLDRIRAPGSPCLIVTARAETGAAYDFVSRFFGPSVGVDEDPVTGAAHCALGPYFAPKLGKIEMTGFQASKRGGMVGVRLDGNRVKLRGRTVTIVRGALAV
jgi:PhzF family phenazine biosynthesis protein